MNRRNLTLGTTCLLTTIHVLLACAFGPVTVAHAQMIPTEMGAGFKAGFTCSAVFHAGRTLDQVLREEIGGIKQLGELPDPVVDYETRSVTSSYSAEKPPRLAVFRDGIGTFLLPPGATLADVASLPTVEMPMPDGDPASMAWPDGDLVSETPLPRDIDAERLRRAIEEAFAGKQYQPHKTIGVVVVYKDRIIAERYAGGWDMHTQYRTWSTAKSITNALIGILVREGKLRVDQPAPISEWQGENDPRRHITIENLLHMSSGLASEGANTFTAYWGGIDTAEDAAKGELEVEPGTRWKYANYDTLLLMKSAREVLPDLEAYLTFPRRELFNKIGMRHTFPETDPYGNFILSSQVYTTPRDLARFGLLYLHDGVWNGERILPEGWVEYSMTPAPARKQGQVGEHTGTANSSGLSGLIHACPMAASPRRVIGGSMRRSCPVWTSSLRAWGLTRCKATAGIRRRLWRTLSRPSTTSPAIEPVPPASFAGLLHPDRIRAQQDDLLI